MKKVFYIVLVIVVLMIAGQFIKQQKAESQTEVAAVEETVGENASAAETTAPAEESAEVIANVEIREHGDETTVEESAEEVVETNPEETADEDETIVEE